MLSCLVYSVCALFHTRQTPDANRNRLVSLMSAGDLIWRELGTYLPVLRISTMLICSDSSRLCVSGLPYVLFYYICKALEPLIASTGHQTTARAREGLRIASMGNPSTCDTRRFDIDH